MEGEDRQQQGPQQPGLRCPRCRSMETKFCYFNNYKKSQPRHFCKTCGRHWTHGGTLRNIPVGVGVKKGRRSRAPSSSTSSGGGTREILRVSISSPQPAPLAVGSGAVVRNLNFSSGEFTLATQILSRPQPPASNPLQLSFTPGNHLSLLQGFSNRLNPFISNPVGQGQGQSRRHPVGQLHQVPISPNGVTGLWAPPVISTTPASANAASKYPPLTPTAAIYWDQNVSTAGVNSGGSSSIDGSGQLPGYCPFL